MHLGIATDHGGFELKQKIVERLRPETDIGGILGFDPWGHYTFIDVHRPSSCKPARTNASILASPPNRVAAAMTAP